MSFLKHRFLATPSCGKDNQDKVKTASLLNLML